MGLSKKKQKTTSTETVGPSAFAQPYIDSALSLARPGVEQSQQVAASYMPRLNEASDYYSQSLRGDFMNGNPHLDNIIQDSNTGISEGVGDIFSGAGRYGSGYHQKILADALARNESGLRFRNYETERGYQDQAGGRLAGLATTATALPMLPAGQYADLINGLVGKYMTSNGTSTTTNSGGLLSGILGAALSSFGGK